jgi:hypothetical protein
MANMSYCRFQNTVQDLQDCFNAIDEALDNGEPMDLSDDEQQAFQRMFNLMEDMMPLMEQAVEAEI